MLAAQASPLSGPTWHELTRTTRRHHPGEESVKIGGDKEREGERGSGNSVKDLLCGFVGDGCACLLVYSENFKSDASDRMRLWKNLCRVTTGLWIVSLFVYANRNTQQEVKVIWQKAPHGGPIPRLGVTPGGRKLYHWIPGVGFPISVP